MIRPTCVYKDPNKVDSRGVDVGAKQVRKYSNFFHLIDFFIFRPIAFPQSDMNWTLPFDSCLHSRACFIPKLLNWMPASVRNTCFTRSFPIIPSARWNIKFAYFRRMETYYSIHLTLFWIFWFLRNLRLTGLLLLLWMKRETASDWNIVTASTNLLL